MVEMEQMTLNERQNTVQAGESRLAEMQSLKAMDCGAGHGAQSGLSVDRTAEGCT